jgi:hypothetical protein
MDEHKRLVRGPRGEDRATHPALLGLAALLLEIASKSSGSQGTTDGIRDTAPLVTGPDALQVVGKEDADHAEGEDSR